MPDFSLLMDCLLLIIIASLLRPRILRGWRRLREACRIHLRRFIQTAFIERVNLTFRQCVSSLSRRTWAYAHSELHLRMHCEWFRAYYHFVRPHESLRVPLPGLKRRYRSRTPAMALGLTDHIWSVRDLLHYPMPQSS